MKILTIQSIDLNTKEKVFADPLRCNHNNAKNVYKRLFGDYNEMNHTNYKSFFWGFSRLLTNDLDEAIGRAKEMIGINSGKILILEIPDELCLETDFYNFADEIFADMFPDELESCWSSIYEKRDSEKQVIFPYIEPSMIIKEILEV